MNVELADVEELNDVVGILSEAAAWLHSRGIEQWPHPFPAEWVEPLRREFAGLGPEVLEWAAQRVREEGRDLLRLDCRTDNAELRHYYERQGFRHRGDTIVDDFRTSLYERRCHP